MDIVNEEFLIICARCVAQIYISKVQWLKNSEVYVPHTRQYIHKRVKIECISFFHYALHSSTYFAQNQASSSQFKLQEDKKMHALLTALNEFWKPMVSDYFCI